MTHDLTQNPITYRKPRASPPTWILDRTYNQRQKTKKNQCRRRNTRSTNEPLPFKKQIVINHWRYPPEEPGHVNRPNPPVHPR